MCRPGNSVVRRLKKNERGYINKPLLDTSPIPNLIVDLHRLLSRHDDQLADVHGILKFLYIHPLKHRTVIPIGKSTRIHVIHTTASEEEEGQTKDVRCYSIPNKIFFIRNFIIPRPYSHTYVRQLVHTS